MRSTRVARMLPAGAATPPRQDTVARDPSPERLFGLEEKRLAVVLVLSVALARLFPYPPVKFALAGVLGLVYLRQLVARPDLALAIYVLALPVLDLLPPNLIPVRGINPQTILIALLLVRALAAPKTRTGTNPFMTGLLVFVCALVLGTIHSAFAHGYTASELLQRLKNQVIVIPVLFCAGRLLASDKQKARVLVSMAFFLLLAALHTIWETRGQIAAGRLLETNRPAGLVGGQPNLFGGWLAMMLVAGFCFLFSPLLRGKARLFLGGTLGLASIAFLYTLSRGAWLAFLFALTVVAVLRNRRILLLGTVLLLLLPTLVSPAVRERAASILTVADTVGEDVGDPDTDPSAMVRVVQWREFGSLFWQSPLYGHGYGYFPELWARSGHSWKAAHSSIIEIGVELGFLGLLGYAALVFPMILLGWRESRSDLTPLRRTVATAALGLGLCLLLLDTSGTRFREPEVMANFWIFAGLLTAPWESSPGTAGPPPSPPRRKPSSACGPEKSV